MRLFVGLSLPHAVADSLLGLMGGVPGARWQHRDQLHLTLRFIGETDGVTAERIHDALGAIRHPALSLQLRGVGCFGGRVPHALWAGVANPEPVLHLNHTTESALQRVGLSAEVRKFVPHVTLARLTASPRTRVLQYLSMCAAYESDHFDVAQMVLFSSNPGAQGSVYMQEAVYPLS